MESTKSRGFGSFLGSAARFIFGARLPKRNRPTTPEADRRWPAGSSAAYIVVMLVWVLLKLALIAILTAIGWWLLPIGLFYLIGRWWQGRLKRRDLRWARRIQASRERV